MVSILELRILVKYNYIVVVGNNVETSEHQHHAVQICLGIDEKIKIKQGDSFIESNLIVINNNISHKLENSKNQMIVLVDSESNDAFNIKKLFRCGSIFSPIIELEPQFQNQLNRFKLNNDKLTIEDSDILYNMLMNNLLKDKRNETVIDERIQESINIIKSLEVKKISAAELAKKVYLSESRLLHLFKFDVGIPLRKYLLWLRIRDAIILISNVSSFTDAAYLAGFSDAAHLTRTCKTMFGVNLAMLFNNSRFIQVIME